MGDRVQGFETSSVFTSKILKKCSKSWYCRDDECGYQMMRTPIVRIPSTGAVAGIQHWRCVAMISHKENQAFSSSNHMQRVEARATVLGKLQSQARFFSTSASRIVQHHSHHSCVSSFIILLARRELRRKQRRRVRRQTNVACTVKARRRAGRRVLDRSMQGGVCLRHDAQLTVRRATPGFGRAAGQRGVSGIFCGGSSGWCDDAPVLNDPPQRRSPAG